MLITKLPAFQYSNEAIAHLKTSSLFSCLTVSIEEDVDSNKGKDEEEGNRGIILKSTEPFNICLQKTRGRVY